MRGPCRRRLLDRSPGGRSSQCRLGARRAPAESSAASQSIHGVCDQGLSAGLGALPQCRMGKQRPGWRIPV